MGKLVPGHPKIPSAASQVPLVGQRRAPRLKGDGHGIQKSDGEGEADTNPSRTKFGGDMTNDKNAGKYKR